MPLTNSVLDAALQLAGLFYAFAGYVGARAVHQARLLDAALDELSDEFHQERTPPREHSRMLWLLGGALVMMAGGLALLLQLEAAAWIFFVSASLQFIYLLAAAPLYFDSGGPQENRGRQRSVNAAILYAAVTVFVLWALQSGHLKPAAEVPAELVTGASLGFAGYALYAFWKFIKPFSTMRLPGAHSERDDNKMP